MLHKAWFQNLYFHAFLVIAMLIVSTLANASTTYSDEEARMLQKIEKQEEYQQLASLKTQIVVLHYHDSQKLNKINQVIETFNRQYKGLFDYGEFSFTETKYYPVKNGKTLKPNMILGIGYSRRATNIFRELLRKAGLNAHVLPSSFLSGAKFEYELDSQNWQSL